MARGEYPIHPKASGVRHQAHLLEQRFQHEIKREKDRARRKVVNAVILLAIVYIVAVVAFHISENWSWEDAVFFTTSTITTVGYGDMVPTSYFGRLFAIPLMWIGIAVGFYVIYTIQDYGRSKLDSVNKHVDEVVRRIEKQRGME